MSYVFLIFDINTGAPKRLVSCSPEMVDAQKQINEDAIIVSSDVVFDLVYVNTVSKIIEQREPQPSIAHEWNWTTKTWDLDLTLAKDQAWARIKQARAAVINAPLDTAHGTFDGDPVSQQNILKAALDAKTRHELGMPSDVEFTLANNTRPTFTMLQMLDVAMAMGNREKAAYATAQTLREQIDAATTPEQLEAIQWPAYP